MSSPLATASLVTSPQTYDDVTAESNKKHSVPSSISSLLNSTKSSDCANARTTSTPSSPRLTVTSPPPTNCGAPEQQQHHHHQQQQRKRPFSALDKPGELSISTTEDNRSQPSSHHPLDSPHLLQQQPSSWSSGNHHQQQQQLQQQHHHHHHHHHLPTPVSPAAPMPQHNVQRGKVEAPQQLKDEPSESDDHDGPPGRDEYNSTHRPNYQHHHHPIPSRTRLETPIGMYTSFSVKQSPTTNTSALSSAAAGATALSPSNSSSLKARSPRDSTPATPKPYTCTECDQTFSRAHNLKSHTATHSLERPYKCESCQAKFRRLHDLKRHQKLHTGERPYICSMCQRSFSRLDALNRHQRTEGGSACHYRQNRRRTDQKRSDSFHEGSSSPTAAAAPAPAPAPPANNHPTSPLTPSVPSPSSAVPPVSASSPPVSTPAAAAAAAAPLPPPPPTTTTTIQQQQQQTQVQVQQTKPQQQQQQQPQRPSPSRPSIPQLNLRHRFTSPYDPDDANQPQPLVFRSASTNTSSSAMGGSNPHETTRRIVLPPPSNSTPTSSTPTQPIPTSLNTFPLHPPPPQQPPVSSPSASSRQSYPSLHDPQLAIVDRRRSSGGGSEYNKIDVSVPPASFNGPESYSSLRTAYMQLLEQYHGLQNTLDNKYETKTEELETLRRKVHDLQVENRVLRSLVFERQQ